LPWAGISLALQAVFAQNPSAQGKNFYISFFHGLPLLSSVSVSDHLQTNYLIKPDEQSGACR
jgi:hypothetical protein